MTFLLENLEMVELFEILHPVRSTCILQKCLRI